LQWQQQGGASTGNGSIYTAPSASRDGDTTDNRKRIQPLENAPPDCPHCRDPETDQPIAMVEGLSESGHERLACPACGLVAVEVLAGGHPYCKQCGRMMQVIGTQFTNTATMIEYGCPVCDLGGKEAEP
jgi:ribosomal protein L37AE/L43A